MRSKDYVHRNFLVLKKTITSYCPCLRPAGLRYVGLRTVIKILGDSIQPLFQPRVIEAYSAEFLLSPMRWRLRTRLLTQSNSRFLREYITPLLAKGMYECNFLYSISSSCSMADFNPIGRLVTSAVKTSRIDKGLRQT